MKRYRPDDLACLVFDDRSYGINARNAEAITNFFQRDARGLVMDTFIRTPFNAISQWQLTADDGAEDHARSRPQKRKRQAALRPMVGTRKPFDPALGRDDARTFGGSQLRHDSYFCAGRATSLIVSLANDFS